MERKILLFSTCAALILSFATKVIAGNDTSDGSTLETASSAPQQSAWGFIENRGQYTSPKGEALPHVLYVTDRPGMRVILTTTGFSYEWQKTESAITSSVNKFTRAENEMLPSTRSTYRVDVKLVGANPEAQIVGAAANTDYINYYNVAQHPEGILGVPNFSKVIYRNVYPNIDWVLYSKVDGSLKYDFIVHPGGNPKDIALEYEGATSLELTKEGALHISTPLGDTEEEAPYTFQGKQAIASNYELKENQIRFTIGKYDTALELTIDPCLLFWGTYYGGSEGEYGSVVATDASGNVYLAGGTMSTNNISSGGHQNTYGGPVVLNWAGDAFLVKFNTAGARLWATYYGGSEPDWGEGVATDASGNVYLAGETRSTNNISSGGHQNTYGGDGDAYLVKFDTAGTRLWATYYGGSDFDGDAGVASDASGNVYLVGWTKSTNDISSGGYQNTFGGNYDAFLVKFNTAGTRLWASYYGGSEDDYGLGVATDASGNVYLAGGTSSTNNISFGGHQNTYGGGTNDAYLVKFNTAGTRSWATYYGGSLEDIGWEVATATDASGNVYLAGITSSTSNISSGGHQNTYGGGTNDAYLVKFNASGTRLWATYYGGSENDEGGGVATDASGNVYLVGWTKSTNDISSGGYQNTFGGNYDAFLVKFNTSGTRLWASYYGGSEDDYGLGVATDASGNVYLAGSTLSTNNISSGGHQNTYGGTGSGQFGGGDAFLFKFNNSPSFTIANNNITSWPLTANFTNTTVNAGNANFTWSFGDGSSVNDNNANVTHTYNTNGVFHVSLTLTDPNTGCSVTNYNPNNTAQSVICNIGGNSNCGFTPSISPAGVVNACIGGNVWLTLNNTSYPAGATFQWNKNGVALSGENFSSYNATSDGFYTVTVFDTSACPVVSVPTQIIFNLPAAQTPTITQSGQVGNCGIINATLTANGNFGSYIWNTGAVGNSITVTQAGVYTAVGQGATGCDASSLPVNISSSTLAAPEICMITVDSITNQSIIVWEKDATNAITGYGIYKETAFNSNNYQQIAIVPYDSLSEYIDLNSDAEIIAERYRISIIDTCGGETSLSGVARAIGLKVFPGVGVQRSLSWNAYVGSNQNITLYKIYSGPNYSQLTLLDSVPANISNYLDASPVNGLNTVYRVYADLSQDCASTRAVRNKSISNGTGNIQQPFVQSISEIGDNDVFDFNIFPNPNNGLFTLVLSDNNATIASIYDITGKLLVQEKLMGKTNTMNLQALSRGTYIVQVIDNKGFTAQRLVVIN